MKFAARNTAKSSVSRRDRLTIERQRAVSLSKLFPNVERLRIELVFSDPKLNTPQPSTQLHTLYPAATAFFRFACPCADCDGDFDLSEAVANAIALASKAEAPALLDGRCDCAGHRFPDHAEFRARCPIQLSFHLQSEANQARRSRG